MRSKDVVHPVELKEFLDDRPSEGVAGTPGYQLRISNVKNHLPRTDRKVLLLRVGI